MTKLSVVILTKNEEKNIKRCLESVKWANEILIVDSGSTDDTLAIAAEFGCRVINTEWQGYGSTKKFGVESAEHDWILWIDADEVVSPELKSRIIQILTLSPDADGYKIRFHPFFLNRKLRFSGWQKEIHLRFFNRIKGAFSGDIIHESFKIKGKVCKLSEPIYHYSYPDLTTVLVKMKRYSLLSAQKKKNGDRSVSMLGAVLRGIIAFFQIYFIRLGFLDGKYGLIFAINSAFGSYMKYLMLWEMTKKED